MAVITLATNTSSLDACLITPCSRDERLLSRVRNQKLKESKKKLPAPLRQGVESRAADGHGQIARGDIMSAYRISHVACLV